MTTFLYIMQTDLYFKVGVTSTSIFKRMKQIQTGCPTPIRNIHYYSYCFKQDALDAEKLLHNNFSKHNTFGEWFKEFSRYVSISEGILNIKFEKIELEINKTLKDYKIVFTKKIKKAKSMFELDSIRDELIWLSDDYFMEDDKNILFGMIIMKARREFGLKFIERTNKKEADIVSKEDITNKDEKESSFLYSDLQNIIKKANINRKKKLAKMGLK